MSRFTDLSAPEVHVLYFKFSFDLNIKNKHIWKIYICICFLINTGINKQKLFDVIILLGLQISNITNLRRKKTPVKLLAVSEEKSE